jgi:hypothetical protein
MQHCRRPPLSLVEHCADLQRLRLDRGPSLKSVLCASWPCPLTSATALSLYPIQDRCSKLPSLTSAVAHSALPRHGRPAANSRQQGRVISRMGAQYHWLWPTSDESRERTGALFRAGATRPWSMNACAVSRTGVEDHALAGCKKALAAVAASWRLGGARSPQRQYCAFESL